MATLADEFTEVFRSEHRQVRDALLGLIEAFEGRDADRARSLLGDIAALTGPHFRYEEESLYPALTAFFGSQYVEKLLGDHDAAIGAAARLVEIAGQDALAGEDVSEATRLVRGILPHVSDCDGLALMVEVLEPEAVESILSTRERALEEGLGLLEWAKRKRRRLVRRPV